MDIKRSMLAEINNCRRSVSQCQEADIDRKGGPKQGEGKDKAVEKDKEGGPLEGEGAASMAMKEGTRSSSRGTRVQVVADDHKPISSTISREGGKRGRKSGRRSTIRPLYKWL